MNFLKNNLGLKIFCLMLSVFLWAWVRYTETPLSERNESQTSIYIPIAYENKRDDLIVTKFPDRAILTVKGPPKVIDTMKPEHFRAVVDLQGKEEGQYWADIGVKSPPGLTVTEVQPNRANLTLEKLEKHMFALNLRLQGHPKEGYTVGKPLFEPDKVEVQGAQSILKRIKHVDIPLEISGIDRDLKQRVQPEPVDKDGTFIPAKVMPEYVRVDLPVRSHIAVATLPVSPIIVGKPLSGYKVSHIDVEPPIATVVSQEKGASTPGEPSPGNPAGRENPGFPAFLQTESIDVKGAKGDLKRQVNIIEPQGASLVNQKNVVVRVTIKKEAE